MRDIDLVLGIGYDHPIFRDIFQSIRDRVSGILGYQPRLGADLRNDIFRAKDTIVKKSGLTLSAEDRANLSGMDKAHWEYQRLMIFRQILLSNPHATLKAMTDTLVTILHKYPIPISGLKSISKMVAQS